MKRDDCYAMSTIIMEYQLFFTFFLMKLNRLQNIFKDVALVN